MNFGEASHVYTPATDIDYKYIEEAYGSYLHGKAQIDFGKFVTNAGAEVVEAKDNWNYTRSLLFQLTIPVYHAGIRMNYAANDKVSFMVGVVNGWNNVVENNTGKTFMASVTLKPSSKFTFIENYIGGPETAGTNDNVRNLSDTVISYNASKVSLMGNSTSPVKAAQTSQRLRRLPEVPGRPEVRDRPALRVPERRRRGLRLGPQAEPAGLHADARTEGRRQLHVAHRVSRRLLGPGRLQDRHGLVQEQPAVDRVRIPLLVQQQVLTAGAEMGAGRNPV